MEVNELLEAYRNREDFKYDVDIAKSQILYAVFNLKQTLNVKQLNLFNKLESSLKEYEETLLVDIARFLLEKEQEKNTR